MKLDPVQRAAVSALHTEIKKVKILCAVFITACPEVTKLLEAL